jgi:hypothetical protein
MKTTADVTASFICGRFHLCATRNLIDAQQKARDFSRAFAFVG